jgi:hypothetical protein
LILGTFYTPGLGACGGTNDESQLVAAVPFGLWDAVPGFNSPNPNNNPVCGHFIKISYNGNSVRCKIVDECMGCTNPNSVGESFSPPKSRWQYSPNFYAYRYEPCSLQSASRSFRRTYSQYPVGVGLIKHPPFFIAGEALDANEYPLERLPT